MDPNSVADTSKFVTKHVHLDWIVDFTSKIVKGSVVLSIESQPGHRVLELDAQYLNIAAVSVDGVNVDFEYKKDDGKFGDAFSIQLPNDLPATFQLQIDYETTEECQALQWLTPEQTSGKKDPFLFSQCQAILARTLLPCQDTPSVKATYTASIRLESPYEHLEVVMSANKRSKDGAVYRFEQSTPIPSYLIAIAVGAITSRQLGPRCSVWAEPTIIGSCVYEFAETERFLLEAEALCGPYVWGIYDMLVLPPSFPYGGMENPCLTFLTPSLLAGDRSLVSVVMHEILDFTHSWTGNLVTNATWEHFWLNEGFTKYVETKLMGRLEGEPVRELLAQSGLYDLEDAVRLFGDNDNLARLRPDLSKISPDEAYSIVPYEKGHSLLWYLEKLVGGPAIFDPYLRAHIQHFASKAITTDDWLHFMLAYFEEHNKEAFGKLKEVDFKTWLFEPGMPPVPIEHDQSLIVSVKNSVSQWRNGAWSKSEDVWSTFSVHQKIMFLDMITSESKNSLPHEVIRALDAEYNLSATKNVEIALKWFMLCLLNGYTPAFQDAAHYATLHGRMKYCRPILRALYKQEEGRRLALDTFNKFRSFYHPQAARMIAKDLHLTE